MKRTWIITVDIEESDQVQRIDKEGEDKFDAEVAYWDYVIETAVQSVEAEYRKQSRAAESHVDYQPIDFTTINVTRE